MNRKLIILPFLLIPIITALAQTPDMYPPPVPEPVEITVFNVILYFVLPVFLLIFYIVWRKSKNKKRDKN